jgi:hypothetical protein
MTKFSQNIFFLFLSFIFSSCVSVKIQKIPEEFCSDKRMPSSEKMQCLSLFESNNLKDFQQRAENPNSGLDQAQFVSSFGVEYKPGVKNPVHDPLQIVSLFTEKNSDGTPNRGGVMIQGTPTQITFDQNGKPAYLSFQGQQVRLLEHHAATENSPVFTNVVKGQDYNQHPVGFGTPVGFLIGWKEGLNEHTPHEVESILSTMTEDGITTLKFESGVIVKGILKKVTGGTLSNEMSTLVLSFNKCDVTLNGEVKYSHTWGDPYDMVLGFLISDTNARADQLDVAPSH